MHLDNRQIKEILTSGNYVEPEDLAAAEKYSAQRHVPLTDYLFTKGLLSTDILGQAIAEYHGMTFADLSSAPPARDQVLRIPEDVAREYRAVLYKEEKKRVVVATDEPTQGAALKSVLKKTFAGKTVEVAFALARDMDLALTHYRQELGIRFTEIMKTHDRVAPQLFEAMVDDALAAGASDIHIEPQDTEVVVRFRVDGILHEVGRIPKPFTKDCSTVSRFRRACALTSIPPHRTGRSDLRRTVHGWTCASRSSRRWTAKRWRSVCSRIMSAVLRWRTSGFPREIRNCSSKRQKCRSA